MSFLFSWSLPSLPIVGVVLALLVVLDVGLKYWKALKAARYHPGRRELIGISFLQYLLPSIPFINASRKDAFKDRHSVYARYGYDVISWVSLFPLGVSFLTADPLAIKEIVSSRSRFPKNLVMYTSAGHFGSNILVTEGETWKRQRKIVAPSFSEKNNRLVWDETIRLILETIEIWGSTSSTVHINDCVKDFTLPLALLVIGSAGFGQRIAWAEEGGVPKGHTVTFREALHVTSSKMIALFSLPKWIINMSKSLREADRVSKELGAYFREMITERKRIHGTEERHDLFSALIATNMGTEENSSAQLTEEELMGNVFLFLLAGHETSAHTLCFALALLAIEQEEQEKLYQYIMSIIPDQELLSYEYFNQLPYVLAVINETMRLFPPVATVGKINTEDTMLPTVGPNGSIEQVFVPANAGIQFDMVGMHYNPRYWPDPLSYNPSRFMGNYNRDAFIPFSAGSRACIGRGFSETEMVAVLTLLIKLYRIELKDDKKYEGLTKLEQRELLLPTLQEVTTVPGAKTSCRFSCMLENMFGADPTPVERDSNY